MKGIKLLVLISILMITYHSYDIYALNDKNEMIIEVSDDQGVWNKRESIDIFKVSYRDKNTNIIINSDTKDKVIAPGSQNSYTFKVKNVSSSPIDYTLHVSCDILPENLTIPLKYRVKRFDGNWVAGNDNNYINVNSLSDRVDEMTLSEGSYAYYTLEWIWPYESINDAYDTYLGDLAKDEDITLTMTIDLKASVNTDQNAGGGLVVDTGDHNDMCFYIMVLCVSVMSIVCLYKKG